MEINGKLISIGIDSKYKPIVEQKQATIEISLEDLKKQMPPVKVENIKVEDEVWLKVRIAGKTKRGFIFGSMEGIGIGDEDIVAHFPQEQPKEEILCDTCRYKLRCGVDQKTKCHFHLYNPKPETEMPEKIEMNTLWDLDKRIVKTLNQLIDIVDKMRSER